MNIYQLALYEALSGLSFGSYVPGTMSGSLHNRSATAHPRGQSLASTANSSTYWIIFYKQNGFEELLTKFNHKIRLEDLQNTV